VLIEHHHHKNPARAILNGIFSGQGAASMEGCPGTGNSRKEQQEGRYPKRLPIEFAENHLFQNKTPPEKFRTYTNSFYQKPN